VNEFEIIRRRFFELTPRRHDVTLGIGDDAALIDVPAGQQLAVSTDTLIEGVHFHPDTAPRDVGWKALAVNLSDLAAMGAEPCWATLALTIPAADDAWLTEFAAGFAELAAQYNVQLVGGDTTRGPLSITVQIMGQVPPGAALRRDGARPGDRIYVTGELGGAGLALRRITGMDTIAALPRNDCFLRLVRPAPRIAAGLALRGVAGAAIDISDGVLGDLGHVCAASGVGARIALDTLPIDSDVRKECNRQDAWDLALTAGDDYELCVTVPPEREAALQAALPALQIGIAPIGEIVAGSGVHCLRQDGSEYAPPGGAFRHFD
jgi:thiamine-monophosphate kinase